MAHKLIPLNQNIKIHQALHGYVDGHREIAASTKLKPHDSKTMLILSDISSSGIRVAEEGYLTGYPLTDSGCYAIAKTWLAPEMTRPGCVWTHTLLIDFADLANLGSAHKLLALFRRPILGELLDYSRHLTIEIEPDKELDDKPEFISPNSNQWLRQLLLALYEKPEKRVVATYSSEFDPVPLVLALWFQQWPRLRRAFCFCTLTTADRSNDRVSFDLQLAPKEQGLRGLFSGAIDAADVPKTTNNWLEHAFEDLEYPRPNSLHKFFRRVGGDVATGRQAFTELTILHKLIENCELQPALFDEIITLLDDETPISLVMAVRVEVIAKAACQVKNLSVRALDFLVSNLSQLDKEMLLAHGNNIGYSLWMKNPAKFAGLFDADDKGKAVATSTLASLSNMQLIEGLQVATELVVPILSCRPNIVMEPNFWMGDVKASNAALGIVKNSPDQWPAAIDAMIASGIDNIVKPAFNCFGFAAVWQVLAQVLDDTKEVKPRALLPWLEYAMLDKGAVAQVLADSRVRTRHSLVTIARMTTPDSVPNEYGKDPWLLAIHGAEGDLPQSQEIYLMSYLFSRALGSTSRSSADLIIISFDLVYRATLSNSISRDAWDLLNDCLPYAVRFESWDRCKPLRQAVAQLFIKRNLAPVMFGQISQDDKFFAEIANAEARLYKGKRYLKKVLQALSSDDPEKYAKRIRVIDKLLG